jgi:hypothetical protein
MTAKTIVAKLQGINALVEGVRSAPTEMPGQLLTEMLPCVLVYPLGATHAVPFYAGRRTEREYLVRVYVAPIGQGEGVDGGYQECLPFLDRFADEYHTADNIAVSTAEWQELTLVEDTGVRADMTLHGSGQGQVYWGVEFTVEIKEKKSVT